MIWTTEKTEMLKSLAFSGTSNKAIAEQIGCSVTDVYTKRSQLGITIDKIKAAQNQKNEDNPEQRPIYAMQKLLDLLAPAIQFADPSVRGLLLRDGGRKVLIDRGKTGTLVNIEGGSSLSIIFDITRKCLF